MDGSGRKKDDGEELCSGLRAQLCVSSKEQERVVFLTHFERGFGLPASAFFRTFLEFFGPQPHHHGAGAIVQLSGFVTLCDGYLGVEPMINL